ncbi:aprataxin-like protein [Drosophila albomicans]|uniref:Aprataxin-like protein n=1 Tax=Drosophila albomicans TaxID=7291 RepID=A0A9C6W7Y3_DROAB|nr:aprataxin-like protein [Drosophila albomicans]
MEHISVARHALVKRLENNKDTILIESDRAAVMKDRYPKAQYHFLIVCKEDIANVSLLKQEHIPLLDHMMDLANQIIEQQNHLSSSNFLVGFKMDAFMDRLSMHVISNDFYSVSFKKVSHWNSFHSDLFLTYQAAYALLRSQGCIEPLSKEKALELRSVTTLQCNQCEFKTSTLFELKGHLYKHWNDREHDIEVKKQLEKITQMLDESKLDEQESNVESPKSPEDSKPHSTQWRSNPSDQNQTNVISRETKPTSANWRQRPNHVPNDCEQQQSTLPYENHFERHFQNYAIRQHQPYLHPLLGQSLMGPSPPFAQGNYYQSLNQFQQPQPRMLNANNTINQQNYMRFLAPQSTESPPRFNPFKQTPNMANFNRYQCPVNPTNRQNVTIHDKPRWIPKPQYKQNQPGVDSPGNSSNKLPSEANEAKQTKPQQKQNPNAKADICNNSTVLKEQPNKANQNKPKWKPKAQHSQGPNNNLNKSAGNKAANPTKLQHK